MVQRWAEDLYELTDGKVTVKMHYSESLLDGDETALGTTDGRTDLGQVGSIYSASDLPLYSISELPFEVNNPEAHLRSLQRLYQEDAEYRESFESRGLVQLFPLPIGLAMLGFNRPVESVDDLNGRTVRASGLAAQLLLEKGVNPVALGAGEIYESLTRGVVEGYILSLANLPTFGLNNSTPYLVDPGIGAWGSSIVVMNEDLYDSMPDEYKDAIQQAAANTIEYSLEELDVLSDEACEALVANGTEFVTFSEEEVEEWADSTPIINNWLAQNEQRGFNAQEVLDSYRAISAEEEEKSDYVAPIRRCIEGNQ